MPILIDGYNLLNASGIFSRGRGGHTLERARAALLAFLADALPVEDRPRTTIVFDAKDAPPGLPREGQFRGIKIFFAARHEEADDLIEEMIRAESSPRQLTVVSSDHRIQRAARRRKALAVDSQQWHTDVVRQQHQREGDIGFDESKPTLPLPDDLVADWLREFEDIEMPTSGAGSDSAPTSVESESTDDNSDRDRDLEDPWNPFPPGYAEDLFDEDP